MAQLVADESPGEDVSNTTPAELGRDLSEQLLNVMDINGARLGRTKVTLTDLDWAGLGVNGRRCDLAGNISDESVLGLLSTGM